jgi:nucleoside-diphosphate-sugar epimerase
LYAFLPRGGKDKMSLVDTKDVARAIEFLMDFEKGNGEAFNLVSFTPTLREVVQELGQILQNKQISIIPVPLVLFRPLYYIARIVRKIKKPQEKSMLLPVLFDKLGQDVWVDHSKIQSLGFLPSVSLDESMKAFGDFLSRNPWYFKEKLGLAL